MRGQGFVPATGRARSTGQALVALAALATAFTAANMPSAHAAPVTPNHSATAAPAPRANPSTVGRLKVALSPVLSNVTYSVLVTGPRQSASASARYRKTLTQTTTLRNLRPGSYTVSTSSVPVTGGKMEPSPRTATVRVIAGAEATHRIRYRFVQAPPAVPTHPLAVKAIPGDKQIVASWSAPANNGGATITGYTVTATPARGAAKTCTSTTQLFCTVASLTNNTGYTVTVRARNSAGSGNPSIPVTNVVPAEQARVSGSNRHVCALTTAQTVKCWGDNWAGQLGNGTNSDYSNVPVSVQGLTGVVEISSGWTFSCARVVNGHVYCWGWGGNGELGDDQGRDSNVPVAVHGITSATSIAAGGYHACAALSNGDVYCWGTGAGFWAGELTSEAYHPVRVPQLANVNRVASGGYHSCALLTDKTVKCWGVGSAGQLGNGQFTGSNVPVSVQGLTGVTAISAGSATTCAALQTGAARCWGQANDGVLGNGSFADSSVPVPVTGVTTAVGISNSGDSACVRLADGTGKCWGANWGGQLGVGSPSQILIPTPAPAVGALSQISASDGVTCAVLASQADKIKCWGKNNYGQLGNGTNTDSVPPVSPQGF